MQALINTSLIFLLAVIPLTGCSTAPSDLGRKELDPYQSCLLAPNNWRLVGPPSEREILLDLLDKESKNRVRNFFRSSDDLREEWFESSSGKELLVCRYDPQKSCYVGGELRRAYFTRFESSWEVGPATMITCSH